MYYARNFWKKKSFEIELIFLSFLQESHVFYIYIYSNCFNDVLTLLKPLPFAYSPLYIALIAGTGQFWRKKMLVSGAISDVLVVLPPSTSLRLPEFRHLHVFAVSDAKGFVSGGFLKVSFLCFVFTFSLFTSFDYWYCVGQLRLI